MTDPAAVRLDATVSGRVQGVGFRYFVLREAMALGLTGWVANIAASLLTSTGRFSASFRKEKTTETSGRADVGTAAEIIL